MKTFVAQALSFYTGFFAGMALVIIGIDHVENRWTAAGIALVSAAICGTCLLCVFGFRITRNR